MKRSTGLRVIHVCEKCLIPRPLYLFKYETRAFTEHKICIKCLDTIRYEKKNLVGPQEVVTTIRHFNNEKLNYKFFFKHFLLDKYHTLLLVAKLVEDGYIECTDHGFILGSSATGPETL